MSRKDNDSLEEFFRKATRQHQDLEYNEDDWKKLERMLDEQQPVRPVGWFGAHGRKLLAGAALVAGLIAVLLLMPNRQGNESVVADSSADTNSGIAATPRSQEDSQSSLPRGNDDSTVQNEPTRDSQSARKDDTPAEATHRPSLALAQDADIRRKPSAEPRRSGNDGRNLPVKEQEEKVSHVGDANLLDSERDQAGHELNLLRDEGNLGTDEKDLSDASGFNRMQVEPTAPAARNENVPGKDEQVRTMQEQLADSASAETIAGALEAPSRERSDFDNSRGRFGITVVTAPDFSMTRKGGAMGTGDVAGVFLHYQVLPRWGVTTGVTYTNKQYWGKGNEYQPPYGYWKALTNGVVPDRIDGTCSMYEVPVAVTFDILSTRRTRVFASAGLSSYFVQSEEYYYHFDTPNPGAVNGWTGKKPSTLWFGIGTLSAGFDFRATRTLSVGIEPYFKVPLEGMGWADIDLYSTGVMFAARYHFARKANKHPPTIQGP